MYTYVHVYVNGNKDLCVYIYMHKLLKHLQLDTQTKKVNKSTTEYRTSNHAYVYIYMHVRKFRRHVCTYACVYVCM